MDLQFIFNAKIFVIEKVVEAVNLVIDVLCLSISKLSYTSDCKLGNILYEQ